MRGPNEVVHVTVPAAHTRGRSHRVAPQHVDGVVQTLQTVLDTTLLQSEQHGDEELVISFLTLIALTLNIYMQMISDVTCSKKNSGQQT